MKQIRELLKKFDTLAPPERIVKEATQDAIKGVCRIDIREQDISISNQVVYLLVASTVKSEIFLHRKEILGCLNEKLPKKRQMVNIV